MPEVKLAIPNEVLQVNPGNTVRVQVAFDYTGPAWRETLYAALYERTLLDPHNEISGGANAVAIDVLASATPRATPASVDIPIPNRLGTFGLYAKLGNILSQYCDGVINIVAATGISFRVMPTDAQTVFPGATSAMYYYWDPGQNKFIGDQKWYPLTDYGKIAGAKQAGGYMAINLLRGSEVSPQYNSQIFNPVNGADYLVWLSNGYIM